MTPVTTDHPASTGVRAGRSSVKARLTPNQRRRSVENDEYASFIRRILRAYARRVPVHRFLTVSAAHLTSYARGMSVS